MHTNISRRALGSVFNGDYSVIHFMNICFSFTQVNFYIYRRIKFLFVTQVSWDILNNQNQNIT